ncbi:MAG TPA: GDCCVxC domain-containing (seleno)protein [Burkholderiales bacterium]
MRQSSSCTQPPRLAPRAGDCCVFCSYGDVPCPPIQERGRCCG